jgi:Fe-S-cluster-containing dehydrogenase component
VPACVEGCPTGCLSFREDGELRSWLKDVGAAQSRMIATQASIEDQV